MTSAQPHQFFEWGSSYGAKVSASSVSVESAKLEAAEWAGDRESNICPAKP
jgi:hypothetical protein